MPRMRNLIPGMTDGKDMLMGTMMDDLLLGGPGDDHLDGGGGDDVFDGGPGGDSIIGGDDFDYVSYLRSPAGVYVDIGNNFNIDDDDKPPVHGGYAEGDTLTEIEGIFGSVFGDTFRGDHQANRLFGYKGNDVIYGADGNDYIRGESGGDNLYGDSGRDELFGDTGNDKLEGGVGNDKLWGGKGDDVLYGNGGNDILEGGEGGDAHHGGSGSDTASYSMSDAAVMINLAGAYVGESGAVMGGHAEGDTFEYEVRLDNPNTLEDESAAKVESIENLSGSMYDDMLTGSIEPNTLSGADGDDTLSGGAGNDKLNGQMGEDMLMGGGGDDILAGGAGADVLEGGEHDKGDTADYDKSPAAVRVDLSNVDRVTQDPMPTFEGGDAEGDTNPKADIENLTGSDYADLLVGNDEDNLLKGGKGGDSDNQATTRVKEGGLFGLIGDDTLSGGEGDDYLDGGDDRDDLWGGSGNDYIKGGIDDDIPLVGGGEYTPPPIVDKAEAPGNTLAAAYAAYAAELQRMDLSDARVAASRANVDITDDIYRAGLFGGAGDDTLVGGKGADFLDGGSGNDTVSYEEEGTDDAKFTSKPTTTIDLDLGFGGLIGQTEPANVDLTDVARGDVYKSIENVIGSKGDDEIIGDRRANILAGGDGEDMLTGNGGADTFVFEKGDSGNVITDFGRLEGDRIDLSDFEVNRLASMIHTNPDKADNDAIIVEGWVDADDMDGEFTAGEGTIIVELTGVSAGDLDADDFIL